MTTPLSRLTTLLSRRDTRGQTLVELSLLLPVFTMILLGIIAFGIGLFYHQQLANAAREGSRFASIHSASSTCPTTSSIDPDYSKVPAGFSVDFCDPWETNWPKMSEHIRTRIFGIPASGVVISACWSGYVSDTGQPDAAPPGEYEDAAGNPYTIVSTWEPCLIDGDDPTGNLSGVGCSPGMPRADTASNLSESEVGIVANRVTVYVCYRWQPPLAGFLLIPSEVFLRASSTEAMQRQQ